MSAISPGADILCGKRRGLLLARAAREKWHTIGLERLIRPSMPGGAFGGRIVENDQGIDGDAGPGVDQKRIDVDRSDAAAGVSHQVGQADERFYGGSLEQRGPAAISLLFYPGLGPVDQFPGPC